MASVINATLSNGLSTSADNSGEIELQSNGTTALKVNTNEGIQILNCLGVGNATPSTSGSGITFPATASPSSDANTLDDYEEGTWTPTDTSGAGLTFTSIQAYYTKVGRLVTLNASFTFPSTANGTGVGIGGIPFAYSFVGAENTMAIFDNAGLGANQVYFAGTDCDFRAAGTNTVRTNANFSLKRVHIMVSYSTSA